MQSLLQFSSYQAQIVFYMFHKVWLTKQSIQFLYILPTFQIKESFPYKIDHKTRKLSFDKKEKNFLCIQEIFMKYRL